MFFRFNPIIAVRENGILFFLAEGPLVVALGSEGNVDICHRHDPLRQWNIFTCQAI